MRNPFTIIIILFIINTLAAQDSTRTAQLTEVTVTANHQNTLLHKTARSLQIITAQQIALAPVKTLDGILQYALNVDVRSRSPLGVQADISLRGGHYDQTLVLLDGIKLNDPQTGHHSLNLPIAIEQIERIEILQGGASRVYGPSAFAGVIHIITRKYQPTGVQLGLAYGQHGLLRLHAAGQYSYKKLHSLLAGESLQSKGYSYNTAFQKKQLFWAAQLKLSPKTEFQWQAGSITNHFGASNFYAPTVKEQYEEVDSKILATKWLQSIGTKIKSEFTASWRRHNDLYDFNNFRTTKPSSVNVHQTNVYDLSYITKLNSTAGTTSLGLEWRQEGVISNRLGTKLLQPIPAPTVGGQKLLYTLGKNRSNKSIYIEQWQQWGNVTAALGTLYNLNSQFGNEWYPGLDLSFGINNHQSLYFSSNRALRMPTFTEMYLNTATVKGDPNLVPEDAWTAEIGLKSQNTALKYTVAVFARHSNRAIDKIKRPELPVPTMETIGNMNSLGLEIASNLNISELLNKPNTSLKTLSFNYAYIHANKKEDNYQSFYTLNYLRHKASFGATWLLAKHLTLDSWYTYKQRTGSYQYTNNEPFIYYKPVKLIDMRMRWQADGLALFADVNNLLGKKYFEFGFVQQPGRWASLGITISR
jgi:vitamin B12 transporter